MLRTILTLCFSALATTAWADAASPLKDANASFPIIVDTDDPQDGPLIIDGCTLEPGADCPGVDLSHTDLRGIALNGANLRGAKLTRANLYLSVLKGADLSGADLRGAILTKAQMQGMKARGADFTGANLDYSRLASAELHGANLTAVSWEGERRSNVSALSTHCPAIRCLPAKTAGRSNAIASLMVKSFMGHCPLNLGERFSRKARTPSSRSALAAAAALPSVSIAAPGSSPPAALTTRSTNALISDPDSAP